MLLRFNLTFHSHWPVSFVCIHTHACISHIAHTHTHTDNRQSNLFLHRKWKPSRFITFVYILWEMYKSPFWILCVHITASIFSIHTWMLSFTQPTHLFAIRSLSIFHIVECVPLLLLHTGPLQWPITTIHSNFRLHTHTHIHICALGLGLGSGSGWRTYYTMLQILHIHEWGLNFDIFA